VGAATEDPHKELFRFDRGVVAMLQQRDLLHRARGKARLHLAVDPALQALHRGQFHASLRPPACYR
jgi:hypothetical protein